MTLAFYAPLKSPDHPTPSGDRQMARATLAALEYAGFRTALASTLRSREGRGDAAAQDKVIQTAAQEVDRLVAEGRTAGWRAWITYHNYYKAPDLLGPPVSEALDIPYFQIESTRAQKRLEGPWASFATAAEAASDAADGIFYFTVHDAFALERDAPEGQSLWHLRPFLTQENVPPASDGTGPICSVGMMRPGDKLASYRLIAGTLTRLGTPDWQLNIIGDGPAREDIKALFAPFGRQVRFLGRLPPEGMSAQYQSASLLFWPGVNEAFGLSYLEAQAHGVPVVAQNRPGVRDVLLSGNYPEVSAGEAGLAAMLTSLLGDKEMRHQRGKAARDLVARHHLLPAAARTLALGLAEKGITP